MARPPSNDRNLFLYILAIFVPPLAVFFKRGFHSDFWINVALTILAWIPGIIHAWWVISRYEKLETSTTPKGNITAVQQPVLNQPTAMGGSGKGTMM